MSNKSYIERIAENFQSPYCFLDWYIRQWEDSAKIGDIEFCIQACLKWMGAEWVKIVSDECILIRAGVQETTIEPYPDWLKVLIDEAGWRENQLNQRWGVVITLASTLYQFAWRKGRESGHS